MITTCNVPQSYRSPLWPDVETLDDAPIEKIRGARDGYMPVASHGSAISRSHKTAASRRAGRRVSRLRRGTHARKLHRWR